ncbi:hypothetical protein NL676_005936 [Syzygium grande]|nr:hypothetical protein NL676_005936 [Syzygium grande]
MMKNHMAFPWVKSTEIIFSGWPVPSSWAFVFWFSVLVEWISLTKLVRHGTNIVSSSLMRTIMYVVPLTVAYMAMLAVMSLDIDVLITVDMLLASRS